MNYAKNPILPGFCPDPSICFANGKYYIVTSTFSYFPGVPVFESEDLQNFKLIGHALHSKEQLPLMNGGHSGGVFAPTIRFHDGVFYMITTNVTFGGNFIVTATDPAGKWSNPHYIKGAAGIDPSLFFDDDGTCWYVGQRGNPKGERYFGDCVIYVQKLNLQKMCLEGDYTVIWEGALQNPVWPEAPHLYKKDGYYHLIHAEGGTGFSHAVISARSKNILGPYQGSPNNPIFSHRALGHNYPIQNAGHADMVETPDGQWYSVMLATRPVNGRTIMGRETFIASVEWESGWPVFNPGEGKLLDKQEIKLPRKKSNPVSNTLHFHKPELDKRLMGLRLVDETMYSLNAHKDYLRLYMRNVPLTGKANPSYLGICQQHHNFVLEAMAEICCDQIGDCAGLAIVQSNEANLQFVCVREEDGLYIKAVTVNKGESAETASALISDIQQDEKIRVFFKIIEEAGEISLLYALENSEYTELADDIKYDFLTPELAGGFVGCTLGMYAESRSESKGYADFSYLDYQGI